MSALPSTHSLWAFTRSIDMGYVFTMDNEHMEQNQVDIDLSGLKDTGLAKVILSSVIPTHTSVPNYRKGASGRRR